MGRMLPYYRLGGSKDEMGTKSSLSLHTKKQQHCPLYAELYPAGITNSLGTSLKSCKSVDLAIRKCRQWSSKLHATPLVSHKTTNSNGINGIEDPYGNCKQRYNQTENYSCSTLCRIYVRQWQDNKRGDIVGNPIQRPKVYQCMKEFLKRKLFQGPQQDVTLARNLQDINKCRKAIVSAEDTNSDFDEPDILNASHYGDEGSATDSSSSSSCSCSLTELVDQYPASQSDNFTKPTTTSCSTSKPNSPQKSILSFSCWQKFTQNGATTDEDDNVTDFECDSDTDNNNDNGNLNGKGYCVLPAIGNDYEVDATECAQLINEQDSGRISSRKLSKNKWKYLGNAQKKQQQQQKCQNCCDDLSELLITTWYQPCITVKDAFQRLQKLQPGSFLIRRKSHHFELCLRVEQKIKQYTVINVAQNYQLKGAKKQFTSLKALVTHHSVMPEQLPLTLILPRDANYILTSPQRNSDDFDTYESLQILGILQNMQTKNIDSC